MTNLTLFSTTNPNSAILTLILSPSKHTLKKIVGRIFVWVFEAGYLHKGPRQIMSKVFGRLIQFYIPNALVASCFEIWGLVTRAPIWFWQACCRPIDEAMTSQTDSLPLQRKAQAILFKCLMNHAGNIWKLARNAVEAHSWRNILVPCLGFRVY
jgi:hypothetical protein